jgi:ribosomal 30S subunit maturation factor RimM
MEKQNLIKLGFVANPHGIRGEAELRLFNSEDSVLEDGMKVFLFPSSQKSKISAIGGPSLFEHEGRVTENERIVVSA